MKQPSPTSAGAAERHATVDTRERDGRVGSGQVVAMSSPPDRIEDGGNWPPIESAWEVKQASQAQDACGKRHDGPPSLELILPAQAESIAAVRHDVRTLGESLSLDPQVQADICLATTEACTNVVLHAYPDGHEGPLEVTVWVDGADPADRELTVRVRDSGRGLSDLGGAPRRGEEPSDTDSSRERLGLGLGLHLMGSLAKSLRLGNGEQGCTEVEMTFTALSCPPNSKAMPPNSTGQ